VSLITLIRIFLWYALETLQKWTSLIKKNVVIFPETIVEAHEDDNCQKAESGYCSIPLVFPSKKIFIFIHY
jgi:hypothetical protein